MVIHHTIFLLIIPLMAIYFQWWAVYFVRTIHYLGEKFSKKSREFIFLAFYLVAAAILCFGFILSLTTIMWFLPADFKRAWSTIFLTIFSWIISLIPAFKHIQRNKPVLIEAGYWHYSKKNNGT